MLETCLSFRQALKSSFFSFLAKSMDELEARYGKRYVEDADKFITLLRETFPERAWPQWAVDSYVQFNREILKEERAFKETGHYSAGAHEFDQVKEKIYENAEVMDVYYLPGLYLSYFAWPHHYELLGFFRESFLKTSPNVSSFMEWGIGHGFFSLNALLTWKDARVVGYDLSPHSLSFSKSLLSKAGMTGRFELVSADVLAAPMNPVDRLICGEILEHVPDPKALLRKAHASIKPGGQVFISGAVNAAQPDHIYLFRSSKEILDLATESGFKIRASREFVHPNRKDDPMAPIVVALVLEHA